MRALKRWAGRLWSGLDNMVAEIEDHDALVVSALGQLHRAERAAQAELERVREDGARLRDQIALEQRGETSSVEQARRATNDEEALEWLRRARRARLRRSELTSRLEEQVRAQSALERHAQKLADRVTLLQRQHHAMRTRTVHAEAQLPIAGCAEEIEEFFERWDSTLVRAEVYTDDPDGAYESLRQQQEERELRLELAQLRKDRQEHE